MEIIPSVQTSKRNAHSFMKVYSHYCIQHNVVPDACIKVAANNVLDFTGDRLKLDEWKPLLEAIKNDNSLHYISVRSRHNKSRILQETKNENREPSSFTPKSSPSFTSSTISSVLHSSSKSKDSFKQHSTTPKLSPSLTNSTVSRLTSVGNKLRSLNYTTREPIERQVYTPKFSPLLTASTVYSLTSALSKCLMHSQTLTGLLLENITLNYDSLNNLIQGIQVSTSLQQLSLPFTQIGDEGCSALCNILQDRLNLISINFTGCNISNIGIESLCKLLKFHKLNRYGESWKQSLRCRNVNPNIMPGLRRVTLCHNLIGDAGVKIIVETLIDDLWVKALDLQNCGVTSEGGRELLNLVKENQCLTVVDIRGNKALSSFHVEQVTEILVQRNSSDDKGDFPWLETDGVGCENKSNKTCRSIMVESSRHQKLYSNTALSILPNKMRKMLPHAYPSSVSSKKLSSSKSNQNQKPFTHQSIFNWDNDCHKIRRRNSDTHVSTNKSEQKIDNLTKLQSLKEQLKNISDGFEDEVNKRSRIAKEFQEDKTNVGHLKRKEQVKDNKVIYNNKHIEGHVENVNGSKSLESLITTLNGSNALVLSLQHSNFGNEADSSVSKPHVMFETLLSS